MSVLGPTSGPTAIEKSRFCRAERSRANRLLIRRSLVRIQAGALGVTTPFRRWVALRGESVEGESDDPL
jgi:hypothetical protein